MDHASAMPVRSESTEAMRAVEAVYANPGAIHAEGAHAKQVLEKARANIALQIAVRPRELIFTSGLTESNNVAILGLARSLEIQGVTLSKTHWITSSIEHDAVLESFAEIERLGGVVTHVEPDEKGRIHPEVIVRVLRPETVLVSIGWANSEIGIVQPIRDISRAIAGSNEGRPTSLMRPGVSIEEYGESFDGRPTSIMRPLFHSDAGQAPLYLSPQVHSLGVDLFSMSSNKVGGPHGAGALYVSNASTLKPVSFGGKQERGLRAGTENVALVVGFAAALSAAQAERHEAARIVTALRDELHTKIIAAIPETMVNGDLRHVLPHMLNISIPRISSEYVALSLDARGIAVSTKSACREGESPESHVVKALGSPEWRARNTLRFSLSPKHTSDDIDGVVHELTQVVRRAMQLSV